MLFVLVLLSQLYFHELIMNFLTGKNSHTKIMETLHRNQIFSWFFANTSNGLVKFYSILKTPWFILIFSSKYAKSQFCSEQTYNHGSNFVLQFCINVCNILWTSNTKFWSYKERRVNYEIFVLSWLSHYFQQLKQGFTIYYLVQMHIYLFL